MRDRTMMLMEGFAALSIPEHFSLSPNSSLVSYMLDVNGYSQIFALSPKDPTLQRRLTATLSNCSEPQWSPESKRIVYVRGTALWTANANGDQAHELIDHPAGISEPLWSPDGRRISFSSRQRGWEHLWSIPANGGTPAQITKGEFDTSDHTWSPNSKWLAFCSFREQDMATRGVYLIPAEGGEEVLVSPRGSWSGAPHFAPDGRILAYLSDQDGWFHIYLYDLKTRSVRQLTHGEFEDGGPFFYNVDPHGGPVFSPDGKQIAFVRNRGGRFDVWVADAATGTARRVSRGDGHRRIVGWMSDSKQILMTWDSPARPPDLWLLSLDGEQARLTDARAAFMHSDESEIRPEWISYRARDGLAIPAALFRAVGTPKLAPAVVFAHGGPNFQFSDFYYPLPQLLAQEGYVVLAPNVRGSTGYGTAFRNANFREWGHADAFDLIDGARWLQEQGLADPDHIAVAGPSYGGYLTLCALTLAPEIFCAGVDMYGDSEIAESYRRGDRYGRLDLKRQMGTPEENPEGYRRGSPVYLAERLQAPVLFLHGRQDMLVVPLMTEKMIEALKIENKYFESHIYEGEAHGFDEPENKKDAWERIIKFLNRHCKGEKEK